MARKKVVLDFPIVTIAYVNLIYSFFFNNW